jgi:outer membrane biosynthesis protein TonB
MLVRLRNGTIGLVGLAAAIGLGLIAVISHQGWPDVSSGPLPPRPPTRFVHHETIALPVPSGPSAQPAGHPALAASPAPVPAAVGAPPAAGPQPVSSAPASEPPASPPAEHVPHHPAPQPPQPATSTPPAPAPPATTSAPQPEPPAAEAPAVTSQVVDEGSPGHSGESHGHAPPWAAHGHASSHAHDSTDDGTPPYITSPLPSYGPPGAGPSEDDGGYDGHGHGGDHWHDH